MALKHLPNGFITIPFPASVGGVEGRCGPSQVEKGGKKLKTDVYFSQLNCLFLLTPRNSATCRFSGTMKQTAVLGSGRGLEVRRYDTKASFPSNEVCDCGQIT